MNLLKTCLIAAVLALGGRAEGASFTASCQPDDVSILCPQTITAGSTVTWVAPQTFVYLSSFTDIVSTGVVRAEKALVGASLSANGGPGDLTPNPHGAARFYNFLGASMSDLIIINGNGPGRYRLDLSDVGHGLFPLVDVTTSNWIWRGGTGAQKVTMDSSGSMLTTGLITAPDLLATSSSTASAFFGDGAHLTGICVSSRTAVPAVAAYTNTTFSVAVATVTLTTRGNPVTIGFTGTGVLIAGASVNMRSGLMFDGGFSSEIGNSNIVSERSLGVAVNTRLGYGVQLTGVPAGTHTFAVVLSVSAGTGSLASDSLHYTQLYAQECP